MPTPARDSSDDKPRVNWTLILLTALITGVITFGGNYALEKIKASTPRLTYFDSESYSFDDGTERRSIYFVRVENNGSHLAEDLAIEINCAQWNIEKYSTKASPGLRPNSSANLTNALFQSHVDNMNPGEYFEAAFLLLRPPNVNDPGRPQVSVRGKGVIGERLSASTSRGFVSGLILPALSAVIGLLIIASLSSSIRKRLESNASPDIFFKSRTGSQRDNLISLAAIYGSADDMQFYANVPARLTYWAESDRLTRLILDDTDSSRRRARRSLLECLTKNVSLAKESRAIVCCNLAKIAHIIDSDSSTATQWMQAATEASSATVDGRCRVDPQLATLR